MSKAHAIGEIDTVHSESKLMEIVQYGLHSLKEGSSALTLLDRRTRFAQPLSVSMAQVTDDRDSVSTCTVQ